MTVMSVSQLKDTLSAVLNRVAHGRERIVVAIRGKPKTALVQGCSVLTHSQHKLLSAPVPGGGPCEKRQLWSSFRPKPPPGTGAMSLKN